MRALGRVKPGGLEMLLSCSDDHTLKIWDPQAGEQSCLRTLTLGSPTGLVPRGISVSDDHAFVVLSYVAQGAGTSHGGDGQNDGASSLTEQDIAQMQHSLRVLVF